MRNIRRRRLPSMVSKGPFGDTGLSAILSVLKVTVAADNRRLLDNIEIRAIT